jgi:hypothetical protein
MKTQVRLNLPKQPPSKTLQIPPKNKIKKRVKTWRNTLWKDPDVKVQEPNIKGLISFGRKR